MDVKVLRRSTATPVPTATEPSQWSEEQVEVEVVKTGGIVLGMIRDIADMIPQKSIVLNPGDRIILYTDGVTEARNSKEEMFSLQKLVEIIKQVPELSVKDFLLYLKDQIQQHIHDAAQYDDITLVVLGRE